MSNTTSQEKIGYESSLSKGLNAVAENDMVKAVTYFENALDQKEKDKKATTYLKQARGYIYIQKSIKNGNLNGARIKLDALKNVRNGSTALSQMLKKLEDVVLSQYKECNSVEEQIKDLETALKHKDYNKAEPIVETLKKIDWANKPYLNKLNDKFKQDTNTFEKVMATTYSDRTHSDAEAVRKNIANGNLGYTIEQLEKIPDSAINAAADKSNSVVGGTSYTASLLAQQYPNILVKSASSQREPFTSEKAKSVAAKLPIVSQDHLVFFGTAVPIDGGYNIRWHFDGGAMGGDCFIYADGSYLVQGDSGGGSEIASGVWKT